MRLDHVFFDRERELAQLNRAWHERRTQFIMLWGRRRVGKSALLSRFAAGKRTVYLYGTRATEQDILRSLALQTATVYSDAALAARPFTNWDEALTDLAERSKQGRLLVILDEFQYMAEATRGLDTLVQRWWDYNHHTANMMLVIASSAFTFMRELSAYRGALHGRRTGQLDLRPFDYFDAATFFPTLSPHDQVRAFACVGGMPAYLRHWDDDLGLAENVKRTFLAPGSFLFVEGEEILRTEFHQEAIYYSILRAIASGEHRLSDIARAVGKGGADDIFDNVRRLVDLQFVRRDVPITEWSRLRTQRVLYRLADPYLRFWFRFVAPFQSSIQLGATDEVWDSSIAPTLDQFIARTTWEEICIQHLWRRVAAKRLPTRIQRLGRWWDHHDEIDIVGLWEGEARLVGECKWTNAPMTVRDLNTLRGKAAKLPLADSVLWVLASRSGFEPALRRQADAGDLLLIEPADLYDPNLVIST